MAHQRLWNKYEVALLIECYINVTEKGCNMEDELNRLSIALRQMALNDGFEIDEVYRNLNGMHWQYIRIKSVFESDMRDEKISQLFVEMVELYKNNRAAFQEILREARRLLRRKEAEVMPSEEVKQDFYNWLCAKGVKQGLSKSWIECLCHVSQYALSHNVSKVDFWQIQDYHAFNRIRTSLLGNKVFKFSHPIDFRAFDKAGKMYSDYIREQFESTNESRLNDKSEHKSVTDLIYDEAKESDFKKSTEVEKEVQYGQTQTKDDAHGNGYSFLEWLINDRRLAESTAAIYVAALKKADAYALEHGIISQSFITCSDEMLSILIKALIADEQFVAYNARQHNRFSAALNAYLVFRLGKGKGFKRLPKKRRKNSRVRVVCPTGLRELLVKKFPYGIRPSSSIDLMKLRGFAEIFGVELSEDDELLKAQIAAGGDSFEGKIYFIADEIITELIDRVRAILDTGVCVVYYDKLYDYDFSWLEEHHISSAEQLRIILKKHMTKVFCGENLVYTKNESITELEAVEEEFKRIWGDKVTHTYDEIYGLLPYIPEEKIRFYLSRSYFFIWSSNETFAWLEKVVISSEEKEEIFRFVSSECETRGFASISNAPLESVAERNYEISITAIYTAVYRVVLDKDFKLNGKIITYKDKTMDALTLTKAYCANKKECSFAELNDYVISITGASGRQIAFQAAYDMMVRVSKDKFVEDSSVQFNVEAIDELLGKSINGDFVQIKGIATFVMFPSCGYTWNHYVLESFCYRFSKKYKLATIKFNDKNAGIIAKNDCSLSYIDMLAHAVAKAHIELTEENVGRYLCDNGYTAKSKMTILAEVTERALKLRRQGD